MYLDTVIPCETEFLFIHILMVHVYRFNRHFITISHSREYLIQQFILQHYIHLSRKLTPLLFRLKPFIRIDVCI